MTGRWVGPSYDGKIITRRGSMARTDDEVRRLIYEATTNEQLGTSTEVTS